MLGQDSKFKSSLIFGFFYLSSKEDNENEAERNGLTGKWASMREEFNCSMHAIAIAKQLVNGCWFSPEI